MHSNLTQSSQFWAQLAWIWSIYTSIDSSSYSMHENYSKAGEQSQSSPAQSLSYYTLSL